MARYARGDDYHDVMREMLEGLHRWIELQEAVFESSWQEALAAYLQERRKKV